MFADVVERFALFLISSASAQTPGAAPTGAAGMFSDPMVFMLPVLLVAMYFFVMRPQQKRAKEQRTLMDSMKSGDEILTSGGLLGRISKVADQYVTIEVGNVVGGNNAVEMTVQKSAVQALLPKGTIKAI